jgi:hypothetical protein
MRYHDQDDVIGFCGDYRHPYGCEDATEVPRLLADDPAQQRVMAAWQVQTRRQTDAEMARREAEARSRLVAKVSDAIATELETHGLELSSPASPRWGCGRRVRRLPA